MLCFDLVSLQAQFVLEKDTPMLNSEGRTKIVKFNQRMPRDTIGGQEAFDFLSGSSRQGNN